MKTYYVLAILLTFSTSICASINLPDRQTIRDWMEAHNVPAVGIGVINGGKIEKIEVYGESEQGIAANTNTLFSIASQTKPIVSMLTLKLASLGRWHLDEPLYTYWIDPDIADHPFYKLLTSRHVLNHSSGFPNWRRNTQDSHLSFDFKPGTQFQYSGEGMEYLRRALERKFKVPFERLLTEVLLEPAGMNNTQYWHKDMSNYARWHNAAGNKYDVSHNLGVSAAGNLWTTVEDYLKFGLYTMNLEHTSPLSYREVSQAQTTIKTNSFYSLGWGLITNLPNQEYAIYHGGSDLGVRTFAVLLPNLKRGIAVMTNSDNGMHIHDRIIAASLGEGQQILDTINSNKKRETITLSKKLLRRYTGIYAQPDGRAFVIKVKGNAIEVSGRGTPSEILLPDSENTFYTPGYDVQFAFTKPEPNRDYQLTIYENGRVVATTVKMNKATIKKIINRGKWTPINRRWEIRKKTYYANSQPGAGILWLNDSNFSYGTIEFDVKGKDLVGKSFVGIVFNGVSDTDYDSVYLRPFTFAKAASKNHALQYMSLPKYSWSFLQKNFPGQFESDITPTPRPNDWVHVKLTVTQRMVNVFINRSTKPALSLSNLGSNHQGESVFGWGTTPKDSLKTCDLTQRNRQVKWLFALAKRSERQE